MYWALTILISTVTGCVSIFAFASLFGIAIGVTSSAMGLKIGVIIAEIKKYESTIKKKKKTHGKIFLVKTKSNSIEVLICKALINSNNSHNKFVLVNNVLKEFHDMKKLKILMINKSLNHI